MTWNAINFKNLLGEMYNNYDMFNLQMISTGNALPPAGWGVTANDRLLKVSMSGLDWVYNNYDTSTGNMTNACIVGNQNFANVANSSPGAYVSSQSSIFRKCITADITISVQTVLGGVPNMAAGTIFPRLSFGFCISPVE
jgi:hypothetical protein